MAVEVEADFAAGRTVAGRGARRRGMLERVGFFRFNPECLSRVPPRVVGRDDVDVTGGSAT
jgi:hypothetical protein